MKKLKGVTICYKCGGKGQLGMYAYGEFVPFGPCKKCNEKGYLRDTTYNFKRK